MKVGTRTSFATEETYTKYGKFLRKYKLDELPQVFNVLKGDLRIVGPRADFQESYDVMPDYAKKILLSIKPGLTSLSSIHFFDEEKLLQEAGEEKYKNYWTRVKPAKILLDTFYIQNRDIFLDLWIIWRTCILIIKVAFKK